MNRPALSLVDEHGELHGSCPDCEDKGHLVHELNRKIAGLGRELAMLKRDRDAEAQADPLWPQAVQLFDHWREVCRHPGCKWDTDRFYLVRPLLKKYGPEVCTKAIAGAQFDPYTYRRKNGSFKRCDEFERIFKNSGSMEDFANRAPREAQ